MGKRERTPSPLLLPVREERFVQKKESLVFRALLIVVVSKSLRGERLSRVPRLPLVLGGVGAGTGRGLRRGKRRLVGPVGVVSKDVIAFGMSWEGTYPDPGGGVDEVLELGLWPVSLGCRSNVGIGRMRHLVRLAALLIARSLD